MVDLLDSEDSLKDLKSAVRTKLGFGENAKITFSQIRSGSNIILEDSKSQIFVLFPYLSHFSRRWLWCLVSFLAFVWYSMCKSHYWTNHSWKQKSMLSQYTWMKTDSSFFQSIPSSKKKIEITPQSLSVQTESSLASVAASTSRKWVVSFIQLDSSRSAEEDTADMLSIQHYETIEATIKPSGISQMVTYLICDWEYDLQKGSKSKVRQWQKILLSLRSNESLYI